MMIQPNSREFRRAYEEHVRRLRCEIHAPRGEGSSTPVRRWIGRQLVRVGSRLADDPSMQPVRSL
jgi:hypothetical protein